MPAANEQFISGARAVAQTINNLGVGVVAAYPITPQTPIVEELAKLEAAGAKFSFARTESEYAAASLVLGAVAGGVRAYSATSSQGLLLMLEVLYNIAGLRLPLVITCANRAVSAPLNIWNDHQDAMAARDAGWLMWFAADASEAVQQHLLAYKVAEQLKVPALVNMDGFLITHTYEPTRLPSAAIIKKFLPAFRPDAATLMDTKHPVSVGTMASPAHYTTFRRQLYEALLAALKIIDREYKIYNRLFKEPVSAGLIDNGLVEYYGAKNAKIVIVALGSICGTIKDALDEYNRRPRQASAALLRLKVFRPWPRDLVAKILEGKQVVVLDRALSPGSLPPLAEAVKASVSPKTTVKSIVAGLGGKTITVEDILRLLNNNKKYNFGDGIFL